MIRDMIGSGLMRASQICFLIHLTDDIFLAPTFPWLFIIKVKQQQVLNKDYIKAKVARDHAAAAAFIDFKVRYDII